MLLRPPGVTWGGQREVTPRGGYRPRSRKGGSQRTKVNVAVAGPAFAHGFAPRRGTGALRKVRFERLAPGGCRLRPRLTRGFTASWEPWALSPEPERVPDAGGRSPDQIAELRFRPPVSGIRPRFASSVNVRETSASDAKSQHRFRLHSSWPGRNFPSPLGVTRGVEGGQPPRRLPTSLSQERVAADESQRCGRRAGFRTQIRSEAKDRGTPQGVSRSGNPERARLRPDSLGVSRVRRVLSLEL